MAAIALAYCYETGSGVEQNKAVAYSMYHALAHRDDRTFATRLPNKEGMDHVRRRMAVLRTEATSTERDNKRVKIVWGEDEIIITEKASPTGKNKGNKPPIAIFHRALYPTDKRPRRSRRTY